MSIVLLANRKPKVTPNFETPFPPPPLAMAATSSSSSVRSGSGFKDPRYGCSCTPKCRVVVTSETELTMANDKLGKPGCTYQDQDVSTHCFRCLKLIEDNCGTSEEYFLCLPCKKEAPECECGSWNVSPILTSTGQRDWDKVCQVCRMDTTTSGYASSSSAMTTARSVPIVYGGGAEMKYGGGVVRRW